MKTTKYMQGYMRGYLNKEAEFSEGERTLMNMIGKDLDLQPGSVSQKLDDITNTIYQLPALKDAVNKNRILNERILGGGAGGVVGGLSGAGLSKYLGGSPVEGAVYGGLAGIPLGVLMTELANNRL